MAKRRRKERYTTSAGYQFSPRKEAELRAAVTNYNRRLSRAIRSVSPELRGAFPSKISFAELAEEITTTRDINKQIKRLSEYRSRGGFELVELGGRLFTKAEVEEIKAAARAENIRRKRLLRLQQKAEEEQGRFRTARQRELEPVTPEQIARRDPEKRAEIMKQLYQQEYVSPATLQWQKNYIQYIRKTMMIAASQGILTEEASNYGDEVVQLVSNLDPNLFETVVRQNLDLAILPEYDAELFLRTIEYIASVWRSV